MNRNMIKKEVIFPKLNHCQGDMSRQWFIYFSVFNPATGKMQVFRKYDGFTALHTPEERHDHARKLIKKWRTKLLNGYNPFFEQDKVKYASAIKYDVAGRSGGFQVETTRNFEYYSSVYLDHVKNTLKRRGGTYTTYKSKLRIFGQYLKKKRIDKVAIRFYNLDTIKEFNKYLIEERSLHGKALNDYNEMLKRFFKYLIEEQHHISENPVTGIRRYDEKPVHHKAYNSAYLTILKNTIEKEDPWLWLMLRMIFNCFLRPKELRFLQMKHINWTDGTIHITSDIAKNKKEGIVTIPDYLFRMLIEKGWQHYPADYYFMTLKKHPAPEKVSKNYLYNKLKGYLKRLNIPDGYVLYSFKHTGVQQLAKRNVPLMFIKGQLRHSSYDQMLPYIDELLSQSNDEIRFNSPEI